MLENFPAMATNEVNMACTRIHDAIQTSGIHFVINQTPWSTYITIRRKFVHPRTTIDDVNVKAMEVAENSELAALRDKNEQLVKKLANIELEKVEAEEEFKARKHKYEETAQHLREKIDSLESTLEEKEVDLS